MMPSSRWQATQPLTTVCCQTSSVVFGFSRLAAPQGGTTEL